MSTPTIHSAVFCAVSTHAFARLICLTSVIFLSSSPALFGRVQSRAYRITDASNLRQIGIASLIYANTHNDRLPLATDVWDYARLLAEDAGLESASLWTSRVDPAFNDTDRDALVLTKAETRPRLLSPEFNKIKPSFAVALGKIDMSMPATTPVAWTRGLQPDGTWAKHSPYGSDGGGHIVFIGGNVIFFNNLGASAATGELIRYDGQGPTNNILEALPPGTRIGEYVPTAEEQASWSNWKRKLSETVEDHSALMGLLLLWLPFLSISINRLTSGRPGGISILLWPLITSVLLAIIVPTY
jgi:hypothetical protein